MTSDPVVEFWLVTYKKLHKMNEILEGLRASPVPHKIVVWDNSVDADCVRELKGMMMEGETLIVSPENVMCFPACQTMLDMVITDAPYIAYVCSTHSEINDPTWIRDCVTMLDHNPTVGQAGHMVRVGGLYLFKAVWSSGRYLEQHPLVKFPKFLPKLEGTFKREEIWDRADTQIHVQGGIVVNRRAALLDIGGFETEMPHYFSDVELSVRMQCHGWELGGIHCIYSAHSAEQVTEDHKNYKFCHYYKDHKEEEAEEVKA